MFCFVGLCFGMLVRLFRGRQSLLLENLALRQQLVALKRRHPRPRFGPFDMLFWVIARRVWSGWKQALLVVTPETVVPWHRTGFRMYWRLISGVSRQVGRRPTPREVWELIFRTRGGHSQQSVCLPEAAFTRLAAFYGQDCLEGHPRYLSVDVGYIN